ncbi:MAG: hypothetical protein H0U99_00335 [Chthoniobacterales bacterium]|nr:hypothetical protein [Chthoniobacterales bacterium]
MVKLATSGNALAVADYFTMFNTVSESNADGDLGSGGTLLLPDMIDANGSTRHLAVGAGKDAHIYLVDRDHMGKFVPNATDNSYVYQDVSNSVLGSGVWSAPAFFNNRLYYGAVNERLRAFPFANARIALAAQSQTATAFTYPGTTPSISAFGLSEGIAWAAENTNPAVLHAYDAGNLVTELYNSNQAANSRDHFGTGNKFIVPTVANGKVYVASTNSVAVFGLFTPPRLANISTRANVMTGENVLIGGFLLHGAGQRQLLIRAIGPSLAVNGTPLTGRLQDPTIEVIRNSAIIATNDNWGDSPQKDQISATGLAPTEPNEAAVLITLGPDAFTAIMRGANNTTGLGLIEVYDVSSSSTCKLVNLSSRGYVGPGNDVLIGGIILNGSGPTKVVVRAVGGSSLVSAGVTAPLADPVLELHDANGAVLAVNDNWQQSGEMQKIFDTGLAPPDPLDAAILASLPSANYTAVVRGKGSATGVALVEVYQLQ